MKEYLESEGVCFGVDCIRSYSEIRKLVLTYNDVSSCTPIDMILIFTRLNYTVTPDTVKC